MGEGAPRSEPRSGAGPVGLSRAGAGWVWVPQEGAFRGGRPVGTLSPPKPVCPPVIRLGVADRTEPWGVQGPGSRP